VVGVRRVYVQVDSTNLFEEDRETDNLAARNILVRNPPPDRTPPVVSNARINNNAPVTFATNVTVAFDATDPTSPGGQPTSGLDSFCLVRYVFDAVQRRFVEEPCQFTPLPAPTGNTFTVTTTLQPKEGVAYAFVWVKDRAGNISRTPGFDAISFLPSDPVNMVRNNVIVFRFSLLPNQFIGLTFTPDFGDVDVSVFDGIGANANRIAVSANNGTLPESILVSVPGGGNPTTFQVEVRAVVNSRFTIVATALEAGAAPASAPVDVMAPGKEIPTTPIVVGPPALQTAIEDTRRVMMPLIDR
jgi:hypothetical protein